MSVPIRTTSNFVRTEGFETPKRRLVQSNDIPFRPHTQLNSSEESKNWPPAVQDLTDSRSASPSTSTSSSSSTSVPKKLDIFYEDWNEL